jgi:hypothetical protein
MLERSGFEAFARNLAFAAGSQRKAAHAIETGAFDAEIVPVTVPSRNGPKVVKRDEHPRPDTTVERLAKLKPVFLQDGTVTAGNASGLNDGAAMLAIAEEEFARSLGLPILAEILSYATVGVDPATMGMVPAAAIPLALKRTNLAMSDIDLFELNEAFAAQSSAVIRELKLDEAKVNPLGGAIALGHPIGASGARILVTLTHALRRFDKEFGVASLCIGRGMGIAIAIRSATYSQMLPIQESPSLNFSLIARIARRNLVSPCYLSSRPLGSTILPEIAVQSCLWRAHSRAAQSRPYTHRVATFAADSDPIRRIPGKTAKRECAVIVCLDLIVLTAIRWSLAIECHRGAGNRESREGRAVLRRRH